MVYITSDLHFNHNKPFIYEARGFSNIEDMNKAIIKNWNSIVTNSKDDVYVLGDIMLGNNSEGIKLLHQLRGNIHIILGNHDNIERLTLYENSYNVVDVCYADKLDYGGMNFYLSHYPSLSAYKWHTRCLVNLCGHTHTKDKFCDMDKSIIYHCELDAHDMKPVSLDTVISDIKGRFENGA